MQVLVNRGLKFIEENWNLLEGGVLQVMLVCGEGTPFYRDKGGGIVVPAYTAESFPFR